MDAAILHSSPRVTIRHSPRRLLVTAVMMAAKLVLAMVLPFFVLVRSATYLYHDGGLPTWLALGAAALFAFAILTIYGAWFSKKVTGKSRRAFVAKWLALPLVVVYCSYTLVSLSQVNAKGDHVRSYYRSLHPILRIGVSTLIIADDGLVITDLKRAPADYVTMELPARDASLHYPQRDGYVHAMDLRTTGRNSWRNWLTERYFQLMGFRTVRHVGTGDHLHVSLPVP